jgi:hypothetical protein
MNPSLVSLARMPRGSIEVGIGTETIWGASRCAVRYLFEASRVWPFVIAAAVSVQLSSDASSTLRSNIPYISWAASKASSNVGVPQPSKETPCRR